LFDDPYAAAFVAAYGDDSLPSEPTPQRRALAFHVIIRTRYFDDYLTDATAAGCTQVVLLAAGLDTRAFRLDWPDGTRLYEVDLPDLLEVKERVLADVGAASRCDRMVVPADLTTDWLRALTASGFDAAVPTAWLVEGLLVYLTPDDAARLLTTVSGASAPGSRIAFERGSGWAALRAEDPEGVAGLWQGGSGDPVGQLTEQGWDAAVDDLADVAGGYGRAPSRPTGSGFVRAVKP
jgi:methyltransferase (TIGR00027 family)